MRPGQLDQLRVVGQVFVQAVLDVETGRDCVPEQLAPRRRKTAALGGDSDEGGGRLVRDGVGDRSDDRDPLVALPHPLGVENDHRRVVGVADDPRIVLP